jgi:hypothetical protein
MTIKSLRSLCTLSAAFVLFLGLTLGAAAQTSALGSIAGIVRDTSGAVIPGVSVVVKNSGTGATRNLTTDSEGHYLANFLQPGTYEVILGGGSFAKIDRRNVPVTVGDTVSVDAALTAGNVSTVVEVTSDAPLLDTEKVAANQVIDSALISNLPVNGRRFDNFVLGTPNVVPDGNSGLISFRGISGIYNSNLVDGANNNQAFFSEARGRSIGAPYVYPVDAIQEFSTENAGYSAEFGQAAGGIINAITKSGTNKFHGDVYEYYRTPGYNAIDRQTKTKPVKVQHQYGISFGGPIIKDKLFFHFAYDGYRKITPISYLSTYNSATQSVSDLAGLCDGRTSNYLTRGAAIYPSTIPNVSPTQCAAALGYLQTQLGAFPRNVKQDIYFPRLDYQLGATHLSASYLFEDFKQPNGYSTATTVNNGGISQNGRADFHQRFLVVNAETAINNRSANVVHFQFSRDLETDGTNSGGPAINITGLAAYGETSALPRGAFPDEHRVQFTDIYSIQLGKHAIKVGGDVNLIHEQLSNLFQGDGSFTYGTGTIEFNFANYVQDIFQVNGGRHYNSFTQVNDPITHVGADDFWNKDIDGFVEDRWKATPKLLISAGLRYDVQLVPQPDKPNTTSAVAQLYTSTINIYKGMIQPRVGFAYTPYTGTVVRGGYGIFYGLNSNSTYYTQRRENGVYQQQFNVSALTNPNNPYITTTPAPVAGQPNRTFQQSGTYAANAPQGGIPEFTPPGPAPVNPVTGNPNPAVNTGLALGTISARGLDPNFKNPQSMSFDLAVEQQLPLHTTLSVGYVGNLARRLPIFVETNVDPASAVNRAYQYYSKATSGPVTVNLPYYTARLSTATGSVLTGFSDVNANYNSLVFTVRKPMSQHIEILANYTWAKAMDGGQVSGVNGTFNGTDTPIDPFARGKLQGRSAEYAKSDLDVRTRLVTSVVTTPVIDSFVSNKIARYVADGFSVSASMIAQTGQPLTGFMNNSPTSTITDGGLTGAELSLNNSGTPGRVPTQIAPRNAFIGPGNHNIDARVGRTFPIHNTIRLELFAEAFNVLNHKNILGVSTTLDQYITAGTTTVTASGSVTCPAAATVGCIVPLASSSTPFGTQTSTSATLYGPRQVQLAAKLYF